MRLGGVGVEFSYGEAQALILELFRETGSHISADMRSLDRAATQAEVAMILLAQGYINVNRDTKKVPKPIELPGPWAEDDPNADVSLEDRAALEQQLRARSPFG